MMEAIDNFGRWYMCGGTAIIVGVVSYILIVVPYFFICAWTKNDPLFDEDTNGGNIVIVFVGAVLAAAVVSIMWPLLIVGLLLWGLYILVGKWGDSYRKIVKNEEDARLTALAQLIKDDPEVKKAYDKLMKENEDDGPGLYY